MALEQICGMRNLSFVIDDANANDVSLDRDIAKQIYENPYILMAPPFGNPVEKISQIFTQSKLKLDLIHGTTTLGIKYQGGILLCADSRGTNGSFIASQNLKKVVELDKCLLGTIAGGAADCIYWDRVLQLECRLYSVRNGKNLPVTSASRIICNIIHRFKGMGLCMGMLFAGYDPEGPKLIFVDSEAQRIEGNLFSIGSGSSLAYGILDTDYRWDLTDQEAYNLARLSIYQATRLDCFSGGFIRLYHITPSGWKLVSSNDCIELHEMYAKDEHAVGMKDVTNGDSRL